MRALIPALLVFASFALSIDNSAAQSSYDLRSPDGRIEIRIRTAGQIRYDVVLKGRAVLENCTLSLDVEHKKLGVQPKLMDAKERSYDQVVEPVVRQKFAKIRDHYNELRLNFDGGYAVVFRAYNEGAAYRFETSIPQAQVKIYGEESAFNFSANDIVYYPQEDSFFSHNERKYLPQHLNEIAPAFLRHCRRWWTLGKARKSRLRNRIWGLSGPVVAGNGWKRAGSDVSSLPAERKFDARSRLPSRGERRLHCGDMRGHARFPGA